MNSDLAANQWVSVGGKDLWLRFRKHRAYCGDSVRTATYVVLWCDIIVIGSR
jgi:hypothetical protein